MFDDVENIQQYLHEPAADPVPVQVLAEPVQQESSKEVNMRLLRERAENAERRMHDLERQIQMNMNQSQPSQKIELEDDIDVSDDMYIEGKQFKRYVKSLKQELNTTRKQFEEYNQKAALSNAEMRLKSQFADFDAIVTKDNLEKLASSKPSLYRSIMANQDIYDRGYSAYEMIKGSGFLTDEYEAQNRRLEENRVKPRAAANAAPQTSDTPLSRVGDYDRRELTEERKEELRQQVARAKQYR